MPHLKTANLVLPPLRDDEKSYKDEHDSPIVARRLVVTVNGSEVYNQDLPLDRSDVSIPDVPASAIVQIDFYNVLEDGHFGQPNSRVVTAPPSPQPIPVPDAVSISFTDQED